MKSPWRSLRHDPPCKDSSFVVATDGRWVRGHRGNKDCIVLDFLADQQVVLKLGSWELEGRYWMDVPMNLLPDAPCQPRHDGPVSPNAKEEPQAMASRACSCCVQILDYIRNQQEKLEVMEDDPSCDKGVVGDAWNGLESVREEVERIGRKNHGIGETPCSS